MKKKVLLGRFDVSVCQNRSSAKLTAGMLFFSKQLFKWRYILCALRLLRDWSLITGRGGGYKTGGGGHVKFYPYEKWGGGGFLAALKGGHKKFWGSF